MRPCPAAVVAALAALAGSARADPATAAELASAAEALAARGELVVAAAKFREAFAADPRPEYACNVGVAYYKADDLPRAHRYLRDCERIGTGLPGAYRDNVRAVLASVEGRLTAGDFFPVDFVLEPTAATIAVAGGLPHDEPLVGSGRAWFPFGAYRVTIRAADFVDKEVAIEQRTRDPIAVREKLERPLAPAIDPTPPVIEPTPAPVPAPGVIAPRVHPVEPRSSATPTLALATSAATAALAISAGVLYLQARGSNRDAEGQADYGEFVRLRDRATSLQRVAWITGGLAGAGAVVSGLLWYRWRSSTRVDVTPAGAGADGAIVWLRGTL